MSTPAGIVIDPVIKSLFPPLTVNERTNLRDLLKLEGFKEELVVWSQGNVLLDGHARYELARELGIEPRVRAIDLPDREAAVQFVIARQLGRRTLGRIATAYFVGKLYESLKRQGRRTDLLTSCQKGKEWADERVAKQYKVSPRTVARNYELAVALDAVAGVLGEEFRAKVLSTEARLTREQILWIGKADRSEAARRRWQEAEAGKRPPRPERMPDSAAPTPPADKVRADNGPATLTRTLKAATTPATPKAPARQPVIAPKVSDPSPYPPGAPATQPAATRSVITRPAVTDEVNEEYATGTATLAEADAAVLEDDATGMATLTEAEPDKAVLDALYELWLNTDHATRMAFLGMPFVAAALRREGEVKAAAAKVGAA